MWYLWEDISLSTWLEETHKGGILVWDQKKRYYSLYWIVINFTFLQVHKGEKCHRKRKKITKTEETANTSGTFLWKKRFSRNFVNIKKTYVCGYTIHITIEYFHGLGFCIFLQYCVCISIFNCICILVFHVYKMWNYIQ